MNFPSDTTVMAGSVRKTCHTAWQLKRSHWDFLILGPQTFRQPMGNIQGVVKMDEETLCL